MSPPPDRDDRKTHAPPVGVAAQIAPPLKKPRAATPVDGIEFDGQPTAVGERPLRPETPMEKVLRRTAETKNTGLVTLEELAELREEHGTAIAAVNSKVDKVEGKLDASIGQNDRILGHLLAIREKRELADIDQDTKDREAGRAEKVESSKARRDWLMKFGAIVLAALTFGVVAIQWFAGSRGCAPPPAPTQPAPQPTPGSGG